jgi:simple sugar transport system permease protein
MNDIDSNTQFVLKGLIIVIAVFLQQIDAGSARGWFRRLAWRK